MTEKFNFKAYSLDELQEYNKISFGKAPPDSSSSVATFRLKNVGTNDATEVYLSAIRCDLLRQGGPRYSNEEVYFANAFGEELVNERWLELRLVGDANFTAVDEYDHSFSVGPIAAGGHVDVEARVSPSLSASTNSQIDFNIAIRVR